jgi:hypothetical protein
MFSQEAQRVASVLNGGLEGLRRMQQVPASVQAGVTDRLRATGEDCNAELAAHLFAMWQTEEGALALNVGGAAGEIAAPARSAVARCACGRDRGCAAASLASRDAWLAHTRPRVRP